MKLFLIDDLPATDSDKCVVPRHEELRSPVLLLALAHPPKLLDPSGGEHEEEGLAGPEVSLPHPLIVLLVPV